MSLPRKGIRRIELEGTVYEWTVRKKPTYSQAAFETSMTLAVQLDSEEDSGVLIVDLGISRPDNWISPHQTAITPRVVKDIIYSALNAGWEPKTQRKTFKHKYQLNKDKV